MPKHEQITTERIKSHLQKYRLHRAKSKKEFVSSYESSLSTFNARGVNGVKSIGGAEVAAHLTYTALNDGNTAAPPADTSASTAKAASNTSQEPKQETSRASSTEQSAQDSLFLPQLTEAEKQSPIGAAMGYLMGLFFSLKQQLMIQRSLEANNARDQNAPVQAVFNSFVAGAAAVPSSSEYDPTAIHGSASFDQTAVLSAPSVRTNLEENTMMKREMQNQMAFQNKMRALKQQELNKYKNVSADTKGGDDEKEKLEDAQTPIKAEGESSKEDDADPGGQYQGAGETAGADSASGNRQQRSRGLSVGASDEFWNTDVVDEQLFEFLMNN